VPELCGRLLEERLEKRSDISHSGNKPGTGDIAPGIFLSF